MTMKTGYLYLPKKYILKDEMIFLTVTRLVSQVEQELVNLSERVTSLRFLVGFVYCLVDNCLSLFVRPLYCRPPLPYAVSDYPLVFFLDFIV
jgi:hypothetical protein